MLADVDNFDEEEDGVLGETYLEVRDREADSWPCWSKKCKRNKCIKTAIINTRGVVIPSQEITVLVFAGVPTDFSEQGLGLQNHRERSIRGIHKWNFLSDGY